MEIKRIDQTDRKAVDAFIIKQWFSMQMVVNGEIFNLGTLDGWFACENDKIIGLITYLITNKEMEILSLNSLIENKGIGTMLIEKAIADAKKADCSRIKVRTTNDNCQALKFYQKRGFDLVKLYLNAVDTSRKIKPQIPLVAENGIPIKHKIELEIELQY